MTNVERWEKQKQESKRKYVLAYSRFCAVADDVDRQFAIHGNVCEDRIGDLKAWLFNMEKYNREIRLYDRIIAEELVEGGD